MSVILAFAFNINALALFHSCVNRPQPAAELHTLDPSIQAGESLAYFTGDMRYHAAL